LAQLRTDFHLLLLNLVICEFFFATFGLTTDTVASFRYAIIQVGELFCLNFLQKAEYKTFFQNLFVNYL
jgi:hypothetical protein